MDVSFRFPFTCVVSGPTKSGKTELVKQLVRHSGCLIVPVPTKIIWAYSEWQGSYNDLLHVATLEFVEGLPDFTELRNTKERVLLVLDDLMQNLSKDKNKELNALFCKGSHHWGNGVATIFIVQNLFFDKLRTARLNTHYLILMKNPADRSQVNSIAKQMYPNKTKYFLESYLDACSKPYGYLLIDSEPNTDDKIRLRTSIFPENCFAYLEK